MLSQHSPNCLCNLKVHLWLIFSPGGSVLVFLCSISWSGLVSSLLSFSLSVYIIPKDVSSYGGTSIKVVLSCDQFSGLLGVLFLGVLFVGCIVMHLG